MHKIIVYDLIKGYWLLTIQQKRQHTLSQNVFKKLIGAKPFFLYIDNGRRIDAYLHSFDAQLPSDTEKGVLNTYGGTEPARLPFPEVA